MPLDSHKVLWSLIMPEGQKLVGPLDDWYYLKKTNPKTFKKDIFFKNVLLNKVQTDIEYKQAFIQQIADVLPTIYNDDPPHYLVTLIFEKAVIHKSRKNKSLFIFN